MVDILSPKERSDRMRLIHNKSTQPEKIVRQLIRSLGYRYRLQARELPGCPDIVFRQQRKAIFVHGCFWHRHEGCRFTRMPKSRLEYWVQKLSRNRERDKKNEMALRRLGWSVMTIWSCELRHHDKVCRRISRFIVKPSVQHLQKK